MIQFYWSTIDVNDEEKDALCNQLPSVPYRTPKYDMVVVVGDLNANV
jgi:hypothetical protein